MSVRQVPRPPLRRAGPLWWPAGDAPSSVSCSPLPRWRPSSCSGGRSRGGSPPWPGRSGGGRCWRCWRSWSPCRPWSPSNGCCCGRAGAPVRSAASRSPSTAPTPSRSACHWPGRPPASPTPSGACATSATASVLVSWTLAVSGVCSTVSLAAVVAVGSAFTGSAIGATIASLASIAVVIPVLVLLAVTRSAEAKHLVVRLVQHLLAPFARWSRSLRPEVVVPAVEGVLTAVGRHPARGREGRRGGGPRPGQLGAGRRRAWPWPCRPSASRCRGRVWCSPGRPARWSRPPG